MRSVRVKITVRLAVQLFVQLIGFRILFRGKEQTHEAK